MRVSVSVAMYSACRSGSRARPRCAHRRSSSSRSSGAETSARRRSRRTGASNSRCSVARAARAAASRDSVRGVPPAAVQVGRGRRSSAAACVLQVAACARGSTPPRCSSTVAEGGHAVALLAREIGAAEERPLVVGRQEHRQRPAAAALGQHLVRGLVDAVEVGALLAVDLDVDEQFVHQRRRRGVLEGLVRHHVAPVAGRVADRQQDRLVAARARARAPPVPTGASRPGCPRAGAGRGWSRRRAGSASGGLVYSWQNLAGCQLECAHYNGRLPRTGGNDHVHAPRCLADRSRELPELRLKPREDGGCAPGTCGCSATRSTRRHAAHGLRHRRAVAACSATATGSSATPTSIRTR